MQIIGDIKAARTRIARQVRHEDFILNDGVVPDIRESLEESLEEAGNVVITDGVVDYATACLIRRGQWNLEQADVVVGWRERAVCSSAVRLWL